MVGHTKQEERMTRSEFGKIVRKRWKEFGLENAEAGDLVKLVDAHHTYSSEMCKAIAEIVMNGFEPEITLVFDKMNKTVGSPEKAMAGFLGSNRLPWDSDWD